MNYLVAIFLTLKPSAVLFRTRVWIEIVQNSPMIPAKTCGYNLELNTIGFDELPGGSLFSP